VTVVLVDDEEDMVLLAFARVLRRAGYDVLTAASGEAALLLLQQHEVQVLATDHHMPSMSGRELIEAARQLSPATVSVLMSGSLMDEQLQRKNDVGCFAVLSKPCSASTLVATVQGACAEWATRNANDTG